MEVKLTIPTTCRSFLLPFDFSLLTAIHHLHPMLNIPGPLAVDQANRESLLDGCCPND